MIRTSGGGHHCNFGSLLFVRGVGNRALAGVALEDYSFESSFGVGGSATDVWRREQQHADEQTHDARHPHGLAPWLQVINTPALHRGDSHSAL